MLLLAAILTGCESYPEKDSQGTEWDKSWTILGRVLGVEDPGNGLILLENPVVLTGSDTYYATWTIGDPSPYTNEEGEETDLYDAQIYLLVYGCEDNTAAEAAVEEWTQRENGLYQITGTSSQEISGQTYDLLSYTVSSDTNPYDRGVSAFTTYHNYAVSAEMTCTESFTGDPQQILKDFLQGCHYSAE